MRRVLELEQDVALESWLPSAEKEWTTNLQPTQMILKATALL